MNNELGEAIARTIQDMRAASPLVHNITNFVVMEVTANVLLAAGASPIMAHEQEELPEISRLSSALVLNIGTLSQEWISSMKAAAKQAALHLVPVILDPVGAGASRLRTSTALDLVNLARPKVIRGNASEIMALAAALAEQRASANVTESSDSTKGVDSVNTTEEAAGAAMALALAAECVVSVSGEKDLITDGRCCLTITGGSLLMPRVTGMGCSATALTAACVAASPDALTGAAAAMALMAEAGEHAGAKADGPGSFLPLFLDELYRADAANAAQRVQRADPA